MCHSSKQPPGFDLHFSPDWAKARGARQQRPGAFHPARELRGLGGVPAERPPSPNTPGASKGSPARPAPARDPFLTDNFLSTDIRVPITLVGTNSGRAVATNAMRGQVWDNFSSDDYKKLPAVGPVRFYNPYSARGRRRLGEQRHVPPARRRARLLPASDADQPLGDRAVPPQQRPRPLQRATRRWRAGSRPSTTASTSCSGSEAPALSGKHAAPGDLRWARRRPGRPDPGFIYRTTAPTPALDLPRRLHPAPPPRRARARS